MRIQAKSGPLAASLLDWQEAKGLKTWAAFERKLGGHFKTEPAIEGIFQSDHARLGNESTNPQIVR